LAAQPAATSSGLPLASLSHSRTSIHCDQLIMSPRSNLNFPLLCIPSFNYSDKSAVKPGVLISEAPIDVVAHPPTIFFLCVYK